MTIRLHRGDLPDLSRYRQSAAVDTETMGLDHQRDRLCVVQLSPGDGTADVIQIPRGGAVGTNLRTLLLDPGVLKIFHFARFDLGALQVSFGVMPNPVYCTKIASRLARTFSDAQIAYAASDVLHLHALRDRLDTLLAREGREDLAAACFRFLPDRVRLDLAGWAAEDIFSHS